MKRLAVLLGAIVLGGLWGFSLGYKAAEDENRRELGAIKASYERELVEYQRRGKLIDEANVVLQELVEAVKKSNQAKGTP